MSIKNAVSVLTVAFAFALAAPAAIAAGNVWMTGDFLAGSQSSHGVGGYDVALIGSAGSQSWSGSTDLSLGASLAGLGSGDWASQAGGVSFGMNASQSYGGNAGVSINTSANSFSQTWNGSATSDVSIGASGSAVNVSVP